MKYAFICPCFNLFISCSGDKEVDYVAKKRKEIVDYIAKII
jgi:hypothetical protein